MAKNITLMGASYTDVPAVVLPQTGGGTASFTDVTDTTATTSDVASGKKFYAADGTQQIGTAVMGGDDFIITLTKNASTGIWEPDCTFAEAQAAYDGGKNVAFKASLDGLPLPCGEDSRTSNNIQYFVFELVVTSNGAVFNYFDYVWDRLGINAQNPYPYYDTSSATATPADVASGKVFYNADGYQVGTASGGGGSDEDYIALIERTTAVTSLPSTVTKIGEYAFYGCSNLALTSLPSGVTSIMGYAFYGCSNLALTSLPSGITSVGDHAFYQCSNLALTSLPSGVTNIGAYAFQRCASITSISCAGAITSLGSNAFVGSSAYPMQIAHVSFPSMTVSSLGYVFGSATAANACKLLEDADIGNTKAIATNAFANCYKLQTLILRKTGSICTLSNVSAFLNTPMRGYNSLSGTIYVPSALISTYQTATNWSTIYGEGHVTFAAIEGSEYEL